MIAKSEDFPDKPTLDEMFFTELARIGAPNHVKTLAESTGGADYGFARQRGIENAMDKMGLEVHTQYILSFPQRDTSSGMHRAKSPCLSEKTCASGHGARLGRTPHCHDLIRVL